MLPRINAAFGKMKISDIRPTHLLAFYDNLSDVGVSGDEYFTATELVGELAAERFATRKAFFTAAGISKRTSQSMFAGGKVTGDTAERVCAVLGADFDELFTADEGGTLSANTIRHYHRLLSVIFSTAVSWQVIYSNPCERVKPPKMRRRESRYLDEKGVSEVIAALSDEPYDYSVMVRMLIYSGLRRGELLGLEWSDLNVQTGCISVERSLLYSPECGVFVDDTNTDGSHRILRPPAEVRAGFTGGVPRLAGGAQGGARVALAEQRPHIHGVGRGNAQPRGAVEVVSQVHRAQGASGREYPRSAAYERYAAHRRGSSAENGVEQAGAFKYFYDGEYLCARDSLRGRGRGGYSRGYSGV